MEKRTWFSIQTVPKYPNQPNRNWLRSWVLWVHYQTKSILFLSVSFSVRSKWPKILRNMKINRFLVGMFWLCQQSTINSVCDKRNDYILLICAGTWLCDASLSFNIRYFDWNTTCVVSNNGPFSFIKPASNSS